MRSQPLTLGTTRKTVFGLRPIPFLKSNHKRFLLIAMILVTLLFGMVNASQSQTTDLRNDLNWKQKARLARRTNSYGNAGWAAKFFSPRVLITFIICLMAIAAMFLGNPSPVDGVELGAEYQGINHWSGAALLMKICAIGFATSAVAYTFVSLIVDSNHNIPSQDADFVDVYNKREREHGERKRMFYPAAIILLITVLACIVAGSVGGEDALFGNINSCGKASMFAIPVTGVLFFGVVAVYLGCSKTDKTSDGLFTLTKSQDKNWQEESFMKGFVHNVMLRSWSLYAFLFLLIAFGYAIFGTFGDMEVGEADGLFKIFVDDLGASMLARIALLTISMVGMSTLIFAGTRRYTSYQAFMTRGGNDDNAKRNAKTWNDWKEVDIETNKTLRKTLYYSVVFLLTGLIVMIFVGAFANNSPYQMKNVGTSIFSYVSMFASFLFVGMTLVQMAPTADGESPVYNGSQFTSKQVGAGFNALESMKKAKTDATEEPQNSELGNEARRLLALHRRLAKLL